MRGFEGQVLTVGQLSLIVGETLSLIPAGLVVEGEVQKVRIYKDFMVFFELSGEGQSVGAFSTLSELRGEVPLEGAKIQVVGEVQTGKKTELRFRVRELREVGSIGEAAKKLEELKLKLREEGAFASSRKKALPRIPKKVAVVTSGSSSAWEDFKRISSVRFLGSELILFNTSVQGNLAEQEICSVLAKILQKEGQFDVVAIVRGGGSRGDLEVFNSERIVREVLKFSIPVVAGIGHEDDVSLLDLVADVRASTPSNAAELIFPDSKNLSKEIERLQAKLNVAMEARFLNFEGRLEEFKFRVSSAVGRVLDDLENRLELNLVKLNGLDFEKIFRRGFVLLEAGGKLIKSVKEVRKGDLLEAKLKDGILELRVE